VNTTQVQTRVDGACAAGYAVRAVNEDGTVACELDDDTTYAAGDGLLLSGNTFSVEFVGSGTANTAARSDHDHWGQSWSGTGVGLTLGSGTRGLMASGSEYGVYAAGGVADLFLAGTSGVIQAGSYSSSGLEVYSNDNVEVHLDDDGSNPNASFRLYDSGDASIFIVEEDGDVHVDGNVECSGCVAGDDVANGSLSADDVDPAGGIYSDKSAIYVNMANTPVAAGTCIQINVACNDANDLPLQGVCTPPLGSNVVINAERISYWDSATSSAEYSCDVCNDGSITEMIEVSMACVNKP